MIPDFLVQAVGIAGMTFNVLSYQGKNAKQILILQLIGSGLFLVNFFWLNAFSGALLNLVGAVRCLTFSRAKEPKKWMAAALCGAFLCCYAFSFLLFNTPLTPKNLLIEALPTVAMLVSTVGFYTGNPKTIRLLGYFCSPCWLTYNIINYSIGGILCESFALVSVTVGLIRFRKKKTQNEA